MKLSKLKHPKMVESQLQARLREQEEELMAMKPDPKAQPPEIYDEKNAKKQGPSVPALNMKMMAKGGLIEEAFGPVDRPDKGFGAIIVRKAEGGMIDDTSSIAEAIMRRRKSSDPGVVEIEQNAQEMPNQMDDINEQALKENYDSDLMDVTQPLDSNQHGDKREMIRAIRSRMISKRIAGLK